MGRRSDRDLVAKISKRVQDRRRFAGLTQDQLAEAAGVSKETLSRIENARTQPSLTVLNELAAAMDCRLRDLVGEPSEGEIPEGVDELLAIWGRLAPGVRRKVLDLLGELP